MPYANNNGVKICYEVEGHGPPLVLAHGASGDMTMYRRVGYVDSLKGDYTLVLVDLRGHGQSDKPQELSAYGPEMAIRMAEDIISVLDDLKIAKSSYFGYSMGAMVGFRAARIYGNRFRGFVLGGMSPYKYPEPRVKINSEFAETLKASLNGLEAALSYRERTLGRPLTS